MSVPTDHRKFLKKRDFDLGCSNIFSEEEHALLIRYGCWMEALVKGVIQPITPAEERFLLVHRGEAEPQSIYEQAWSRLMGRRAFEKEDRGSPHYHVFDAGEAWFPRSANWRYH